MVEMAVTER